MPSHGDVIVRRLTLQACQEHANIVTNSAHIPQSPTCPDVPD